jgi:hypothetical protein
MGVAIVDYNEASADAARSASSCAVIMPVTTAATMSAHRADNHSDLPNTLMEDRPQLPQGLGMSNRVS